MSAPWKKERIEKNKVFIDLKGETQALKRRFLRLVDRLESEMVRMDVAVADLRVGYYALVNGLKTTVSTL